MYNSTACCEELGHVLPNRRGLVDRQIRRELFFRCLQAFELPDTSIAVGRALAETDFVEGNDTDIYSVTPAILKNKQDMRDQTRVLWCDHA